MSSKLDHYASIKAEGAPAHVIDAQTTPPTTPTPAAAAAHQIHTEIQSIYEKLSVLPSLEPGEQVNCLLTRLVNLCISPCSADVLSHLAKINGFQTLCERLRPLCATAEGELENHWAQQIIQNTQTTPGESPPISRRSITNATSPRTYPPPRLPLPPKLHRPLPPRMLHPRSLPPLNPY